MKRIIVGVVVLMFLVALMVPVLAGSGPKVRTYLTVADSPGQGQSIRSLNPNAKARIILLATGSKGLAESMIKPAPTAKVRVILVPSGVKRNTESIQRTTDDQTNKTLERHRTTTSRSR